MERELKRLADDSSINQVQLSSEKEKEILTIIMKQKKNNNWRFKYKMNDLLIAIICSVFLFGIYEFVITDNSSGISQRGEEGERFNYQETPSFEMPLNEAQSILPKDIYIAPPPFQVVEEPIVSFTKTSNEINNIMVEFEGKKNAIHLNIIDPKGDLQLNEIKERTNFEVKSIVLKNKKEALLLLSPENTIVKTIFERDGYLYFIDVYQIINREGNPSQLFNQLETKDIEIVKGVANSFFEQ
jgi:hypothetical protein